MKTQCTDPKNREMAEEEQVPVPCIHSVPERLNRGEINQ